MRSRACLRVPVLSVFLSIAAVTAVYGQSAQDGFDPGVYGGGVEALAVQPDGRIVVGGFFSGLGGGTGTATARVCIGRINPDGSVDPSFSPGASDSVMALAVQPDGRILVGGGFLQLGGGGAGSYARQRIGRLYADGDIDYSFDPGANGTVWIIVVQPDGKILVAGDFTTIGGGGAGSTPRNRIARLNADGSVDASFNPGANATIYTMALQPDGKILVGGHFTGLGGGTGTTPRNKIGRLNADGSVDLSFDPGASDFIGAFAVQPDGMILVGGDFSSLAGATRNRLGRLFPNGTIDPAFDPGANELVTSMALQPNGQVVVAGYFTTLGGGGTGTTTRNSVGRLNANGSLDTGFNPGANAEINTIGLQQDGSVIVGGYFSTLGGGGTGTVTRKAIARLHPSGALDTTLNPGSNGFIYAMAAQPDGKVVVTGDFSMMGGGSGTTPRSNIARLLPDGVLDPAFAPSANGVVRTAAIQRDGRIVIGGDFTAVDAARPGGQAPVGPVTRQYVARLNADGTLDATFNPGANEAVYALVIQPDDKILLGGNFTGLGGGTGVTARSHIGRLNADGTVDDGFNPGANGGVYALAVQPDGAVVAGGSFTLLGGLSRYRIGRITAGGGGDYGFNPGADGPMYAIALQPDGKILVGGGFSTIGGGTNGNIPRFNIARLDANGAVDSFEPGASGSVLALALQSDGKVIVGGTFDLLGGGSWGSTPRNYLGRVNADGSLDTTFDPNPDFWVQAATVQPDGKVLLGGGFLAVGGVARSRVARVVTTGGSTNRLRVSTGGTAITWDRGGPSPQFARATYGFSTDGVTYTEGSLSPFAGGWRVTGVAVPTNQKVYVRAYGFYSAGLYSGSSSIETAETIVYVSSSLAAPAITQDPAARTLEAGGNTTFSAAASGLPVPTYRWELTTDAGGTWSVVPNAAPYSGVFAATLTIAAAPQALTGTWYRAVATNSEGSATSAAAVLTVTAAPLTDLVVNGAFASGTTGWKLWATPDMSYVVSNVTDGVFQYYRVPPPAGTTNQAVIYYETGVPVVAQAPLVAQFDLGNSSSVRKRISVLILDSNFSDLAVCTFWIPAGQALTTYTMTTHSTRAWANAAIYFYAATTGSNGGYYRLDNVSLQYAPAESAQQTTCVDPTAPTPPGGAAGPTLLTNGDFNTGTLSPWGLYGQIVSQISAGVFEFYRPAGTPAGVVLQNTAQAMTANEILTATFQLGNSSGVRKRVTVLVHDNNFTDLSACTFYLEPGQALSTYAMRMFATKAWTNATLSVYPATVGTHQWIRLDNVSLQRTPGAANPGTLCAEPGAAPLVTTQVRPALDRRGDGLAVGSVASAPTRPAARGTRAAVATVGAWQQDGQLAWRASAETPGVSVLDWPEAIDLRGGRGATLTFLSRGMTRGSSWAELAVRVDGGAWTPLRAIPVSDDWQLTAVDLDPFAGSVVDLAFVFHAVATPEGAVADSWQVSEVNVELAVP